MLSKRKFLTGLLGVFLITSMLGCGNNVSKKKIADSKEKTFKGEMTVYTSQPDKDIQALVKGFNKKQPDIKVNIFRSGTEEVVSKVLAEKQANAVQADVLLVADAATFESLKSKDILMSYKSPELKGISNKFYDAENTYTGTKIISTGIIVNTDMLSKPIKSFSDLTKEDLKNNMIMPSPLYSGAAAYNLGVITRTKGLGWDFFQGLKKNQVKVDKGNGAVQKSVIEGQKTCGMIVDYMAIRAKEEGAPVEFIYPSEGSPIITEPVAIIKNTKKQELAKAFVDYILSEEGQELTSKIGYTPIRSTVASPKGFKNVDEIKNLEVDLKELVSNRDADKEKFSKLFK